ncbi:terpenoid synthase [Ramaria rubella]|nr:terpenoid synthase [Ramaria rubella]
MTSQYRYALIHLYYTLPPAVLLHLLVSPVRSNGDVFKISLLVVIAVASTTPWDSYLIRTNIWSYPPSSVLGTLLSIPIEEYFFFIIQTYITSSLYLLLGKPVVHSTLLKDGFQHCTSQIGACLFAAIAAVGVWMVKEGNELLYLGLILAWAGPFLTFLTALCSSHLKALPLHVSCGSILIPTIYFWMIDSMALHNGIWIIEKDTKLNWQLWGALDIEEALFFLITNTLVVLGLVAWYDTSVVLSRRPLTEPLLSDKIFAVMDAFPDKFPPFDYAPSPVAMLRALTLRPSKHDIHHLHCLRYALQILQTKSPSFYFASAAFPNQCRLYLLSLYAFCRVVDDLVDEAPNLEDAQQILKVTRRHLELSYSEPNAKRVIALEDIPPQARAAFSLLPSITPFIPIKPFLDLLAGFESDLNFFAASSSGNPVACLPIRTDADLLAYCERVASTVAHMFVYIVWHCTPNTLTDDERAWILAHATQMGIALQLVNIARDVVEDARSGRVYIPVSWFEDAREMLRLEAMLRDPDAVGLDDLMAQYALRLVRMAKKCYADAEPGLKCIPRGCRRGARLAIEIYMEIGREIERRNGNVRKRVVVDKRTKLHIAFTALYR